MISYGSAGIVLIVAAIVWPPGDVADLLYAAGIITFLIGDIITGKWGYVAIDVACLACIVWRWWRRRKRKHAAALLGAKAKALRDALVRKAREVARPRPVLRPAPVPR